MVCFTAIAQAPTDLRVALVIGNTATGKGLAQVDAPPGTFLAYATAPGNVAEDGDEKSGNGLYTQYLLQELKKPTAKIEDVFKRVRLNVRKQSEGRQIPWESTSLEDDFFFNDGKVVTVAKLSDSAKESAFNAEKADWDKIKDPATGQVRSTASASLRRLSDDILESVGQNIASSRVNAAGFVTQDGNGSYDPPWPTVPGGEFQVGKKWSARSIVTRPTGAKEWVDIDAKIAAYEGVTVPLGTFDTFRVDYTFTFQNSPSFVASFWYQPEWEHALKLIRTSGNNVFIREMVTRERGKG